MLVTLARAREESKLTSLSDAELTRRITAAQERIENWCHRKFELQEHTESYYDDDIHDDKPIRGISLRNFPVILVETITRVNYDGSEDSFTNETTGEAPDGFRIRTDLGELWTWREYFGHESVVTYTAGYGTIPESIQEACVALIIHDLDIKAGKYQSETLGDRSQTVGPDVFDKMYNLPINVARMLGAYRRIPV